MMQWHTLQQDWGKSDKEKKRGRRREGGEEWCAVVDVHPERKKGKRE